MHDTDVAIVGAGIGGLALALCLHRAGVDCRVFEAAPRIAPIGVGINVLPHASKVLCELGLEDALAQRAVTTREVRSYNRFGQLINIEPLGRHAGYVFPQFSIHRGDLQGVLREAVENRLGPIECGHRCTRFSDGPERVEAHFVRQGLSEGEREESVSAKVLVGCDGVHSVIRAQLHPHEGQPRYSGVNMWRGVTTNWPAFLTGASMVRAGWLPTGKLLLYPIRNLPGGLQMINWVAEFETPEHKERRDWNLPGRLEDFAEAFADWKFDWLNVPDLLSAAESILEYPMVDQPPLQDWGHGRVTLLGDAAHPMIPRGSNGAAQAILDAVALSEALGSQQQRRGEDALRNYEETRLPATAAVVSANYTQSPDSILREVYERTGDKPFTDVSSVISESEIAAMRERYQRIAGFMPAPFSAN